MLHAEQYGVGFSYGIELVNVHFFLGQSNLKAVFDKAKQDKNPMKIGYRCFIDWGDIQNINYFDPFTHVLCLTSSKSLFFHGYFI